MTVMPPSAVALAPVLASLDAAAVPSETDPPETKPQQDAHLKSRNASAAAERYQARHGRYLRTRQQRDQAMQAREKAERDAARKQTDLRLTSERRQHGQELEEVEVVLVPATTTTAYDEAARETRVEIVLPAITARTHRIRSPLDTLERGGDVGPDEVAAGRRYAREYEVAERGGRGASVEVARGGSGAIPQGITEAQVDAITSVRRVREALGYCAEVRLRAMLVEELSFTVMAARLLPGAKRGNETIRAQSMLLLSQLAEHYRARDR
ncbi:hypothetical protein [Rhizosaccharibacter radicis]|uniref:Uncharacterized protein n=1 Tax=Rhizosaccharibacter radicis TaxID=2782605 RepID=A0ABT1VYT0_9PROT|nr:hypothetical protein [Acetobacteraceae bacterium KSS12]